MNSRREELLRATAEAARVRDRFPVRDRTSFDIVGVVTQLGIPLLFRPLKGLWGAALTVDDAHRGVLVTTKLGLAVQRFTLAHELCHVLLGHQSSFDEKIGFAGRFGPEARTPEEFAADAFASELLAPRSLMVDAARARSWTKEALHDAANVYQLALRLGISFEATCWALAAQHVLPESTARAMTETTVQDLKRAVAPADLISNSRADVWRLREADSGAYLEAGPEDVFALDVRDNVSGGYLWELVDSGASAQVMLETPSVSTHYGESAGRTIFLKFATPGVHRLLFEHRRPWNKQRIAHIDIAVDTNGKEVGGFARQFREQQLAFAVGE